MRLFPFVTFCSSGTGKLRPRHPETPDSRYLQDASVSHKVHLPNGRTERNPRLQRVHADDSWHHSQHRSATNLPDEDRHDRGARDQLRRNRR